MKLFFVLVFFCLLISCQKENNANSYSDYIVGTYYCERIDAIVDYSDSTYYKLSATDSVKLPKVVRQKSLDKIIVISTGDSTISVGSVPCKLQPNYKFHDTYGGNASWYSGYFINDSIYFNYGCLCMSGFQIKGKRK